MMSLPPKVGGRYKVERELVAEEDLRRWAALDTATDTPVELIAPRAHVLLRPGAREAFDEVTLDHPAWLPMLGRLEVEGVPLRVRPVTQGTLAGVPLTPDDALAVARWLVPAVQAAGGAFGGELRPEDVVVDGGGAPRLAAIRLPRPESLARVPFHRAPELDEDLPPDAASDLFGLGVLLYRAVAGVEPYPADSPAQLRLRTLDAPLLSEHTPVPPELDALVADLVSLDPTRRAAVKVEPLDTPPTILLERDHDAPFAARTALTRVEHENPDWLVLVPLKGRSAAELRKIALRSGVAPEAITKAAERGLEWVVDEADSEGEATRLARRHLNRGVDARIQATAAPGLVQMAAMAMVAWVATLLLWAPFSWAAGAFAAFLTWRTWRAFRAGVQVAQARYALSERRRAPASQGAEGRAWALDHRLREATHLPGPLRADLREAVEAASERLEQLAVQETELGSLPSRATAEREAPIRAERDRLCRALTRMEMEISRAGVDLAHDPDAPVLNDLGRLANELKQRG